MAHRGDLGSITAAPAPIPTPISSKHVERLVKRGIVKGLLDLSESNLTKDGIVDLVDFNVTGLYKLKEPKTFEVRMIEN